MLLVSYIIRDEGLLGPGERLLKRLLLNDFDRQMNSSGFAFFGYPTLRLTSILPSKIKETTPPRLKSSSRPQGRWHLA